MQKIRGQVKSFFYLNEERTGINRSPFIPSGVPFEKRPAWFENNAAMLLSRTGDRWLPIFQLFSEEGVGFCIKNAKFDKFE